MQSDKDNQLLEAVYAVDKRVAVLETQHDLRWEQQDKLQRELHADVKEIKASVAGLRVKVARVSVTVALGSALLLEIAKKFWHG